MPSFTIKQLDERLLARLRDQARKQNVSLSAYVRAALAKSVGFHPGRETFDDLADLAGSWSRQEAEDFEKNTAGFGEIDDEMWN